MHCQIRLDLQLNSDHMLVSLIAAIGRNYELGKDNQLLWHLPNDLKFFKQHTLRHAVVMGRRTFESIGRPLPNRINIVVSQHFQPPAEVYRAVSLADALEVARENGETECFVIGGARLFSEALDFADKLYITRVDAEFEADVFFPEMDMTEWELSFSEAHPSDEKHAYPYTFEIYDRKM